jgi:glycosyltransferase 2 family protein
MTKKIRSTLIKIIVSVFLFAFILYNVDLPSLVENFKQVNLAYIPFILGLIVLNYVVSSFRWKQLLIHEGSEKASVRYLTSLYFVGSFFNNFMPTSIGGDVYKIFKLGQKIENNADAFSATFMERFTGMIALVIISYFGLVQTLDFWLSQLPAVLVENATFLVIFKIILFVGFWVGAVVAFLSMKILATKIDLVKKVYDSLMVYKDSKKVLISGVLTSFIVQLLSVATQYFVLVSLGIDVPFMYTLFVFPVVFLASIFIPSLNGFGVQDALYIQFFMAVGVTTELALSASIVYHLFKLSVSLFGGILYAMGKAD